MPPAHLSSVNFHLPNNVSDDVQNCRVGLKRGLVKQSIVDYRGQVSHL